MTNLELKRMKLELLNVANARATLEFRIEERLDEIEKIKATIDVQLAKEMELNGKIAEEEKSQTK